eukprot:553645_1
MHPSQQFNGFCCVTISSVDGEEFDFFPISFFLYLSLLILTHILILLVCLFNRTLFKSHPINFMHYPLIYIMLILSIWVSLFSFYRYYTTLVSIVHLTSVSTRDLFQRFSLYAAVFAVLFVIQIHVLYWLFPLVICMFGAFNLYCTYRANAMLIQQYRRFLEHTSSNALSTTFNLYHEFQEMLKSLIFTQLRTNAVNPPPKVGVEPDAIATPHDDQYH